MRREGGFTLVELLLSVVIIGLLVGVTAPLYNSFLRQNDLDITLQQVAHTLRRAQTYARGVNGDSVWSVAVQSDAITLFKGTTFASRDTSFDEVISLPATITASGLSEVQFSKVTAAPNTTGTVNLTTTAGEVKTVTLNAKGMVEY